MERAPVQCKNSGAIDMIIFGAGGHGKVLLSILKDMGKAVTAVVDENPEVTELMGYPVILPSNLPEGDEPVILAIGDNRIRFEKALQMKDRSFLKTVHSSALIDEHTEIDSGAVIMPNAVVNSGSKIAAHSIINTSCVIEHDCRLGQFVHIAPNATVCGGCSIGTGTLIGAGAVVLPGIQIGQWCTIGAGSVVHRDIPDKTTVVGNPAREIFTND